MTAQDLHAWLAGFDELFARVAGRFGRVEPRRRARSYLLGLLAPVERKNSWQLAEAAGDDGPEGMQRLLNFYTWDADAVRDDLRAYVVEQLGGPDGVLIVDETGFPKKGDQSAGVQRQHSGTAGRVENCQLGVFLAYVSAHGRALIDRELYLPKSWTSDPNRCARAGIPSTVEFATKPALARTMLARAFTAGVPARWVTADEAYRQDSKFRRMIEQHRLGYVVAVPRNQSVGLGQGGDIRADSLLADIPDQAWKRIPAGQGAKGPRWYDWAAGTLHWEAEPGFTRWVLLRRSLTDPNDVAFYLCYGPIDTSTDDLVRVAGTRWAIEECFASAKHETGLDHYQVRRYAAWYRHITLAMLAHAYLAVTAAQAPKARAAWSASHQQKSVVSWHI
ncbi:IS701 family transposase [Nonomuraea wenchangensis]